MVDILDINMHNIGAYSVSMIDILVIAMRVVTG